MSAADELRDPWGWLVAGLSGGLGWAVLAGTALVPGAAVAAGAGIAAVVLATKVAVGVARGSDEAQDDAGLGQRQRDRLPLPPQGSTQADLLVRSLDAVERIADLSARPGDPWVAGELQQVLTQARPVAESLGELAGRVTILDSSVMAARPDSLAAEIAALQARIAHASDPDVRREQERALAALDAQADSVDRLLRRRDTLLAQMQAATVGLEGLAARSGELVALGPAGEDTEEASRIVGDLTASLDSVRMGIDEARSILRDL